MATSLTPIKLPSDVWVDLYDATGITVGVQLIIQNIGARGARLSESLAEPISTTGYNIIEITEFLTSASTPVGAWAISNAGTTLQVEEA